MDLILWSCRFCGHRLFVPTITVWVRQLHIIRRICSTVLLPDSVIHRDRLKMKSCTTDGAPQFTLHCFAEESCRLVLRRKVPTIFSVFVRNLSQEPQLRLLLQLLYNAYIFGSCCNFRKHEMIHSQYWIQSANPAAIVSTNLIAEMAILQQEILKSLPCGCKFEKAILLLKLSHE